MDTIKDAEDASTDGEEDFESADEGEVIKSKTRKDDEARNVLTGNFISQGESNKLVCDATRDSVNSENRVEPELRVDSVKIDGNISYEKDVESSTNVSPTVVANSLGIGNEEENPDTQSNKSSHGVTESTSSGWGWGSWGAVLNQATSTMTSGLSQVIEKVETTLGIPEPGELQDEAFPKDEKNEVITLEPKPAEIDRDVHGSIVDIDAGGSESFFSSWGLSSFSKAVTSKGLEIVSEGIDALETIGKKTMDVISEGDPGLRGKRELFKKPSLSQILREAKEESAKEAQKKIQDVMEKANFNDEFDRYQGLAHLEALEILSQECEAKIESMLIDVFDENLGQTKSKLRDIEDVFRKARLDETDHEGNAKTEFAVEIGKYAMALNLAFLPIKLNQTEESISKWLEQCAKDQETSISSHSPDDIYSHVITSLADITAKSIEVFRKVAEMILMGEDQENTVTAEDRANYLFSLMKVVTNRISSLSTSYAQCLNTAVNETEDNDNITPVITEVYLECSNSSSHVQDAFKLLLPVLQVSALNSMK